MRVVLVLLLVANAGLFVWQQSERGYQHMDRVLAPAAQGNIRLLSERDAESSPGMPVVEPPPVVPHVSPVELECWALGPFGKLGGRSPLPEALPLRWLMEEYERDADYWVYLGPFDHSAAANTVSRGLTKDGVDSYVVRRGELENAVSLGVFSDVERAKSHAEAMRGRGYAAKLRRIAKRGQRQWLVMSASPGSEEYGLGMQYLRERQAADVLLAKKSCNLIASYRDFD